MCSHPKGWARHGTTLERAVVLQHSASPSPRFSVGNRHGTTLKRIVLSQRPALSVNIGSSGGQNSRACTVIVPIPRDTYSGANVSRYHPATNRPLPVGV